MAAPTIAVIGAGFSGTLLSLHLLRHCAPSTRIRLIERSSQFGRGAAFATGNPNHLLNVPAGRMSAFEHRPNDFIEWLQQHAPAVEDRGFTAQSFLPRRLYGLYIRSLLNEELKRSEGRDRFELVRGDVLHIDRSGDPLALTLDRDRRLAAELAVLAVGTFPPASMPVADPSFYDTPLYRADPWAPDAVADLDPQAAIMLIGTGLTMADLVVSLLDQGHQGPIYALSRRGLLPLRHATSRPAAAGEAHAFPSEVTALLRFMRDEARAASARGGSWQPIVDELRPFMQDVWQVMSAPDRARFLRHLRPWWEVHRHRIPPAVADRITAAQAGGQLTVRAGRVAAYHHHGDLVDIEFRPRGSDRMESVRVARVVNCSGPGADYDRITHPLIRSLLADGTVRPDPLRLGLDVTAACALLHGTGAISRRLFAVGPVTKGAFWEITAVPDIRRQCELLAQHLAKLVKGGEETSEAPRAKVLTYAI
jgi:uncharacterized NAD(P)/FAD-binding protein YdhS